MTPTDPSEIVAPIPTSSSAFASDGAVPGTSASARDNSATNTVVKRGRGLSTTSNVQRQRSSQGASRSQAFTDSGVPPQIPTTANLRRSPSLSHTNPPIAPRSTSAGRSLSRSQSNVSLLQSTPSSPAFEAPMPDLFPRDVAGPVQKESFPFPASNTALSRPSASNSESPSPAISRNVSSAKLQSLRVDTTRSTPQGYTAHEQTPTLPQHSAPGARPVLQSSQQNNVLFRSVPVLDVVLQDLFDAFVAQANAKIESCAGSRWRFPSRIDDLCSPGADPGFDQLLKNMGFVAKSNPKALIDRVMAWKFRHDNVKTPASAVPKMTPAVPKRSMDVSRSGLEMRSPSAASTRPKDMALGNTIENENFERRSSAASCILCRCLIEVLSQASLESVTKPLAVRLEEIIFDGTINKITREEIQRFSMQRVKWSRAAEVLGVLSVLDFGGVVGRYNLQLKKLQATLGDKPTTDTHKEGNIVNLLVGLRYLRPRAESGTSWFQISAGINSLVEMFLDAHGEHVKIEYCYTIEVLLSRTASTSQAMYDDPKWRKMLNDLGSRLNKMSQKLKYSATTFPVQISAACTSPNDIFTQKWQQLLETAPKYLRERPQTRQLFLKAACRMVWCYLQRKFDSESVMIRSIEELARMIFFSGRKFSLSREPASLDPLIQFVRIIGATLPSTCFRSIIFPLMGAETILSKEATVQSLDPDRVIVGIRSFLALIGDLEKDVKPPFPFAFGHDDNRQEEGQSGPMSPSQTPVGRSRKVSLIRGERLSEPVETASMNEAIRTHYHRFCEILTKLIRICDDAFGGQASLDEKFAAPTLKTPLAEAWNFAKRDELLQNDDARLGHYDLLHVSVQALPRCLSSKLAPSNELINLLCTGTAHVDRDIAASSALSLKSIARQGWAQEIVNRFSAFIFKYESRYATMSDGGLLGPGHIESTLRLYIELLNVWKEELQRKRSNQALGIPRLDVSTSQSYVDRVEAQGLFFLCSPSHKVRSFAVDVFGLVTQLDGALGETNARLYNVFSNASSPIFDANALGLTFKERAHLGRIKHGNFNGETMNLSKSNDPTDVALWNKVFPYVIKAANNLCYMTVSQTREDVCDRLSHLQSTIETSPAPTPGERPRATTVSTVDSSSSIGPGRNSVSRNDITVEQWKLYLIFACATITRAESPVNASNQEPVHTRQSSRSSQNAPEALTNAADVFNRVVPLLFSEDQRIRQAAVSGLGAVNINIYRQLLESLSQAVKSSSGDTRKQGSHVRAASSPRREPTGVSYHLEVVQLYEATSHFLQDPEISRDTSVMDHVAAVTRDMSKFLARDADSHSIAIRAHFCGFLERFYGVIVTLAEPSRYMSFSTRKAIYVEFENWWDETSPGDNKSQAEFREMQIFRFATASAMAALCAGPLFVHGANGEVKYHFQAARILGLIDVMLKSEGDRIQNSGKRALRNLIRHNRQLTELFQSTVNKLYDVKNKSATLESYLEVLIDVVKEIDAQASGSHWKLFSILLFTLGSTNERIRMRSLKLLRVIEEQHGNASTMRNFDIRVSDKTRAVNIAAQYNIVEEIIRQHEDCAYAVFSEYTRHFEHLPVDSQRSMIHIMLPWMKKMDLQIEQTGRPTATTHMTLLNMLVITVRCEARLHHEIQALWHGLIDGKYAGNARVIIDFVISLALESKNEAFIKTARQVAVYMASHEGGKGIYEFLLARVEPQSMRGDEGQQLISYQNSLSDTLFVAPLSSILEPMGARISLSIGQLSLILLVDLIVEQYVVPMDRVPYLVQACLVLWDHHLPIVQDSAREMLVHLIHVLVISKVDKAIFETRQPAVEDLVDLIRRHDPKVGWEYTDNMNQQTPYELPESMLYVVSETVSLFNLARPGFEKMLAETAVAWATHCVVRHQACRSWHVYRCLLPTIQPANISVMLFQLSGTVSEASDDVQCYAMDVIRVIRAIAETQTGEGTLIPHVFWATCSILYTIHEYEFREAISILDILLDKCDARDPLTVQRLLAAKPHSFDESFPGVANFVHNGVRSFESHEATLAMLDRLLHVASSPLIGDESRLRFTLLANMPRLLHSFDDPIVRSSCLQSATTIHDVCYARGLTDMAFAMDKFRNALFRGKQEFLMSWAYATKDVLDEDNMLDSFVFVMGMLYNQVPWMRLETLRLLETMVPLLQPLDTQLAACGPGLFMPLLSLTQTEFCSHALKIIDRLLPPAVRSVPQMTGTASTPISTTGELPSIEDLGDPYGQPKPSGWCVASPELRAKLCRSNMEALHAATLAEGHSDESQQGTPGFEFQPDYFPMPSVTTIGDLTAEIDDMDDFFEIETDSDDISDESVTASSSQRSVDVSTESEEGSHFTASPPTGPLHFHQAKRRGPSVHSINSGYSQTTVRASSSSHLDPSAMSPSAFTATPNSPSKLFGRPPLLSRSVTMPVSEGRDIEHSHRLDPVPSSPEGEPFSDDDAPWSSRKTSGGQDGELDSAGTIRPDTFLGKTKFSGLRSLSLRRFASNAADKHRRAQTATAVRLPHESDGKPQVPKVPEEFLVHNRPNEA